MHLKTMAERHGVPLVDFAAANDNIKRNVGDDHPTEAGYQYMAKMLCDGL